MGGSTSSGGASASAGSSGSSPGSSNGGFSGAFATAGSVGTAGSIGSGGYGGNPSSVCGNGLQEWLEQCDDGNAVSDDGCSSLCEIEPGYVCAYYEEGYVCEAVSCGDSRQDGYYLEDGSYVWEVCDDGNTAAGDGCDDGCELESGWVCNQPGTPCHEPVCGDGLQDYWIIPNPDPSGGTGGLPGSSAAGSAGTSSSAGAGGVAGGGVIYLYEACDDGNAVSGDGCSASCEGESGWLCEQPGLPCRQPICGDGRVDFIPGEPVPGTGIGGSGSGPSGTVESCDDGNTTSGDGCSATCEAESGWLCQDPGTPCRQPACGDGFVDFIPGAGGSSGSAGSGTASSGTAGSAGSGNSFGHWEGCDDGNLASGDGCSDSCSIEDGWACWYYSNSPCHPIACGDGIADYPEQCDDANNAPNDGCTNCEWDGGGWGSAGGGGLSGIAGSGSGG